MIEAHLPAQWLEPEDSPSQRLAHFPPLSSSLPMPNITSRLVRRTAIALCLTISSFAHGTAVLAQSDEGRRRADSIYASIDWAAGPVDGSLGTVASVQVPKGCKFTEGKGAKTFIELTQNPTSGQEQGLVICTLPAANGDTANSRFWWAVFEYDASGYVKDDERKTLDAAKILETITEATSAGNDERRSRGWTPIRVAGWVRPPYYDSLSHNLTWASSVVTLEDANNKTVNHSVRLLGRGGVMNVDLVSDPVEYDGALPTFSEMIGSTKFNGGHTYAEWKPGDKVAKYGLTALVAGGAGAAAMKLGLFGKAWKLILAAVLALKKLLIVVVVAVVGFVKKLFGKKDTSTASGSSAS